jgi:hypothetical protein
MHPKEYEEMNRGNGYIWLDESRERDSTFTLQNQVAAYTKNEDPFSITMNIMGPAFTGCLFLGD